MSSDPLKDHLRPEEMLDIVIHYVQSENIQLVEWNVLLHRRMNVPRIVSVTRILPPFRSLSERTFVELFFSCSRRRFW